MILQPCKFISKQYGYLLNMQKMEDVIQNVF